MKLSNETLSVLKNFAIVWRSHDCRGGSQEGLG